MRGSQQEGEANKDADYLISCRGKKKDRISNVKHRKVTMINQHTGDTGKNDFHRWFW